ncbi:hypothetical protein L1280_002455 [Deinococcus sp. HSC-46F16]|uniref:hypothetical protein n=1 Tax=Deinococcus sp. HSC-46F16 TaxID=2910968 RepID=UPI00209EE488|nr:hypothetical protein [Deinococcus sp. HSC-46F16]MCP2015294.1 hypothetical protein [Deinococcus sp. HSC-46F16]
MTDADLDFLLAQARAETSADTGAADRFLARHRAALLPPARRTPLWPPLLAVAAVLAGVLVLRPTPALPASAAYDVYQGTLGEGW